MAGTREMKPSALGLRGVELLKGLPLHDLEELALQCKWRRYPAGQRILTRAARDRDVFLVVSGRVRVTAVSAAGKQVTFRDMSAGNCFGELAAIDGALRSADVVALQETLLAVMSPAVFRRIIDQHPFVREGLMQRLVASVRELTERVFDLSTLGVQNRVHAELLRLARVAGVTDNRACIDPAPKHTDIASQVSTYREQVTRELSALAKLGLIKREGNALVVANVAGLAKIVDEVRRAS